MNTKTKLLFSVIFFVGIVVLIFSSCKQEPKAVKVLSFNVGTEYHFIGLTPIDGEEHFCFLKIFDTKGILKDSVPLSEAEKILGDIFAVYKVTPDSIFVYGQKDKTILAVNNKGIPLKEKKYNRIEDGNGYYYALIPSVLLFPFMSNTYKGMYSSTVTLDNPKASTFKQTYDNVRKNGYLACALSPFSEKEIQFGVRYSDIVEFAALPDSSYFFSFFSFITYINNRFYMISDHSRYVYELSEDFSVINSFKILDDKDLVVSAIPFDNTDDQDLGYMDEKISQQHKIANQIRGIHYDAATENYLIIVKNGVIKGKDAFNFPFKVLIYDSDFSNKIKEFSVDSYDYNPNKSFVMDGNLYVQKENEENNAKEYEVIPF